MVIRVRSLIAALALTVLVFTAVHASAQALIDPKLTQAIGQAQASDLLSVIVTYNAPPTAQDVATLKGFGIQYGVTLSQLPMAGVWATGSQIGQIAALSNVQSIYLNAALLYFNKEGTAIIGAVKQRTMPGYGYSGRGVGVAVVDSGIDATHPDLPLGSHVVQNTKVAIGGASLGSPFAGVVPATYAENLPDTDDSSGHGTHCAGIVGGLGTQSSGDFAGVAPGANLVGVSVGETIVILWALEGWDYVLTHQYVYNIKVVSNSWGTSGAFDPNDPINVASKMMHDRGITVCFASGNNGPGSNTLNPYSVAPWVIGVAAGDKKGKLADFSSRGIKDDPLYHPTITAPGVEIVSCRSKDAVVSALGDPQADATLPVAEQPYYMHLSGTSMATPNTAGACALLLEANPALTPDQIKSVFTVTATPMAAYQPYQVGTGYLNVLAGLDLVKNPSKVYGTVLNQTYNAKLNGSQTTETWSQAWDPTQPPPTHNFTIGANALQSDIFLTWGNQANALNLAVTDPSGNTTSTGSNLLAAVYGDEQSESFAYPAAGSWYTTVYGLKGQSTGTTGIGVPDTINGTINNYYGTFSGLNDIANSPYAAYIRQAVAMRLMDSYPNGNFYPNNNITRGQVAQIIASDCEVRQNLLNSLPFTDVSSGLAPYVQAVTSAGAPILDTYIQGGPIMSGTTGSTFTPNGTVIRAEVAMWLVRALGMDAQAQANMNTPTSFTDDSLIPAWARGYVVVANNIGLMTGFANSNPVEGSTVTYSWQPLQKVVRGAMAVTIVKWHNLFLQQ